MKHITLFNLIAPIYALFYKHQKKGYQKVLDEISHFKLDSNSKVLDIACGTGGLTGVLSQKFTHVIGIDGSHQMIKQAKLIHHNQDIDFIEHDLRFGLPYNNQSFDLITTAYFLHGIPKKERKFILCEMKRVAKHVLVFDYYGHSNLIIDVIEWLEQGDYFNFKKTFIEEFKDCFAKNSIISLNSHNGLYINNIFKQAIDLEEESK